VRGSILQCMVTAIEGDGVPYIVLTKLVDKDKQVCVVHKLYQRFKCYIY